MSWSYAVLALVAFVLAGVSMVVDWLGPPMIFAFTTVCSALLVGGAIQWKLEQQEDRRPRGGGGRAEGSGE